jgi:hypothetical protein
MDFFIRKTEGVALGYGVLAFQATEFEIFFDTSLG